MKKDYSISIYLDKRRLLKSKKYPVRLRVYIPDPINPRGQQKLYPTKFEFTKAEFASIWETEKPRKEHKSTIKDLQSLIDKAEEVAEKLQPFTFDMFEKRLYQKPGNAEDVFLRYQQAIAHYEANNQIGTASSYDLSLKSIKEFLTFENKAEPENLLFREINPLWLQRYENFMVTDRYIDEKLKKGRSHTTVGIYLRPLRALYKQAIADGTAKQELYPFGRRKYEIPQPGKVKKALSREQLKKLYEAKPENRHQEKAKDFWFFLFNAAGINIKDLARLKYSNLHDDKLIYIREKTKRTAKTNLRPVVVHLNDYAKAFIEKYGNPDKVKDNYIFDIFSEGMTEKEKFRKAGLFTRTLNENVKNLAKANGLPEEISTYWSRHSFATNAIRGGATLEQMMQALNHHDLSTTQGYFAGFEDESMKQLTDNLMNF